MTFPSMAQLRQRSWPTQEAAIKELKSAGFPVRGKDYEVREYSEGSWQIMPFDDVPQAESMVAPVKKAAAKKKASKAQPEAITTAKLLETKEPPEPPLPTKKQAEKAIKAAKKAAVDPDEPVNDMTQPPAELGPYTLRLGGLAPFKIADQALAVSRKHPGLQVTIIDKNNKVVRTIDARLGKKRGSGEPRAPRKPRDANAPPSDIMKAAIKLAERKQGVTRADLKEVSDRPLPWTIMLKDAERWGYKFTMGPAPEGSGSRTVYHLVKTA